MIQAKLIQEDTSKYRGLRPIDYKLHPLKRWYLKGRFCIGTWGVEAPKGAVMLLMGSVDLATGIYKLYGPVGQLPG